MEQVTQQIKILDRRVENLEVQESVMNTDPMTALMQAVSYLQSHHDMRWIGNGTATNWGLSTADRMTVQSTTNDPPFFYTSAGIPYTALDKTNEVYLESDMSSIRAGYWGQDTEAQNNFEATKQGLTAGVWFRVPSPITRAALIGSMYPAGNNASWFVTVLGASSMRWGAAPVSSGTNYKAYDMTLSSSEGYVPDQWIFAYMRLDPGTALYGGIYSGGLHTSFVDTVDVATGFAAVDKSWIGFYDRGSVQYSDAHIGLTFFTPHLLSSNFIQKVHALSYNAYLE